MKSQRIPVWLVPSIVLTALLSLYSISYRYRAEQRNKAVSIAAEYEIVETLAAAEGKTVDQALKDLKGQGLGSVVLSEEYLGDLTSSGRVSMPAPQYLIVPGGEASRVVRGMNLRFPKSSDVKEVNTGESAIKLRGISGTAARGTPVGINPSQCVEIKKAGLAIVARMANPPGVSADYARKTLAWAHELGATIFLPMGDQVLGRREALKEMTDELQSLGMLYASPEFSKIGGDDYVLRSIPENVVRLHSAQAAELDKLKPDEAVERYSLAARERGMRVLLVRPLSFASAQPLASFGDFIKKINLDCQKQGLEMGTAHPFADPNVPNWLFLLIGLSIVPAAYFVGSAFIANGMWRMGGLVFVALLGVLASTHRGRPFTALLAAISFPMVAFLMLDSRKKPQIVLDFIIVSLTSLVGGLAVAGLLNGLPYFIRAEQFEGVKLAVFLPIALVAFYFLMRGTDIKATLKDPVTWGAALIAILVLGALIFMSGRTGNDNAGVSDSELKFRFLLDRILMVRPRTKEFMVGHPLLVIGIGLLALGRRKEARRPGGKEVEAQSSYGSGLDSGEREEQSRTSSPPRLLTSSRLAIPTALFLAGGAIGQTDIVNTMCHIHTPVMLSLVRIGVGMVAGCIIGLAVWGIAKRWLPAGDN